jgi:hypothetical protein
MTEEKPCRRELSARDAALPRTEGPYDPAKHFARIQEERATRHG